jgi:hypothetical protein
VNEGLPKEEQIANTEGAKNIFKAFDNNYNTFREFQNDVLKEKINSHLKVFNDKNTEKYLSINLFGGIQKPNLENFPLAISQP